MHNSRSIERRFWRCIGGVLLAASPAACSLILTACGGTPASRKASPAPNLPASLVAPAAGPSTSKTYLFSQGWVVTEPGDSGREATIAVRDGRVVRVGPDESFAAERSAGAADVSVRGRCIVPGLTDAHGHLYQLGASLDRLTFVGADYHETLTRIDLAVKERRAIRRETDDEWIEGRGWDQNLWPGKAFPARSDLDLVAPVNPVFLVRIDGHAAWANSVALRKAGITRQTVDPAGGKILRDAQGDPTGVLLDRAVEIVDAVVPQPTPEIVYRRLRNASLALVKLGITSVHEAGVDPKELAPLVLEQLEKLAEDGKLPLRVYVMLTGDADRNWLLKQYKIGPRRTGKDDRIRIRAVKFYADGALGSRGAALLEDYSDDPGNRGLLLTPQIDLKARMEEALKAGFQIAVHAIGDRGNRMALDLFESLRPVAGADPRFRIEHAQVVSAADIPRFAALGVIASMQPTHATSDMPWAESRLGPERVKGAYAWKTLLLSGAHLAGGSDFPVEKVDPTLGLYAATTRMDTEGKPEGGWRPEEKLTADEALALFSTGAAYAAFEEGERGRIAPGYRADFTIYSVCPTRIPVTRLPGVPVKMTVVAGDVVYSN